MHSRRMTARSLLLVWGVEAGDMDDMEKRTIRPLEFFNAAEPFQTLPGLTGTLAILMDCSRGVWFQSHLPAAQLHQIRTRFAPDLPLVLTAPNQARITCLP